MNRIPIHFLKSITSSALLFAGSVLLAASESVELVSLDQLLRPITIPSLGTLATVEKPSAEKNRDRPEHIFVTVDQMMVRLVDEINGNLEEGDKLELTCKADFRPVRISGEASWEVYTDDRFTPDTRGNWFPLVVLEVNGELHNSWRLPLKAALYRTVHMATHRIDRGESPRSPSLKPVACNIYDHRGSPISAKVDLSEYELIQPVSEGRFLSWGDVTKRPDVRRGDMVEVLLEKGALSITLVALSLESGVVGQTVSLRNTRSRQEFTGVISGTKRVQVIN